MATQRTTQIAAEVLRQEDNKSRVTQVAAEVLRQEDNKSRVTQIAVEVLVANPPPVRVFEGWGSAI